MTTHEDVARLAKISRTAVAEATSARLSFSMRSVHDLAPDKVFLIHQVQLKAVRRPFYQLFWMQFAPTLTV